MASQRQEHGNRRKRTRPRNPGAESPFRSSAAQRRSCGRTAGGTVSGRHVARLAYRWPEEVAESLGVSRSWLYDSGIASELRIIRTGKVRLVTVRELERVLD